MGSTNLANSRLLPVERRPESMEILRYLLSATGPKSIRDISEHLATPEVTTRQRLFRLEAINAVSSAKLVLPYEVSGNRVWAAHYVLTQYGRDCAYSDSNTLRPAGKRVNSVFALASSQ